MFINEMTPNTNTNTTATTTVYGFLTLYLSNIRPFLRANQPVKICYLKVYS